jgi:hypothetical protein
MSSSEDRQQELNELNEAIGSPNAAAILARFRSCQPSPIIAFWNNFVSNHPAEDAEFCKL